jgi:iron(III) transport system substrate-binding protein
MNPVLNAFKQKYGLEVDYWRSSAQGVLQRAINERNANRCNVDAFTTVGEELEGLQREKLLTPIKTPLSADLLPGSIPAHGEWIGTRINIFAAGYNTNVVKKEDVPKSWEDFRKPIWKGKLAVEDSDIDWFSTFVTAMGESKAIPLLKDIVRINGIELRKGHTAMAGLVAAGDIPMALTLYNYKPEQLKKQGAPIEPLYLSPLIGLANGVGVSRCAPHPHAAVLFMDYMVSVEGQTILDKLDFTPTNPKVRPLPQGMKLTFVNAGDLIDNKAKWDALWDSTIVHPK